MEEGCFPTKVQEAENAEGDGISKASSLLSNVLSSPKTSWSQAFYALLMAQQLRELAALIKLSWVPGFPAPISDSSQSPLLRALHSHAKTHTHI